MMDGTAMSIAVLVMVGAAVVLVLVLRNMGGVKRSPGQITIVKGPRQGEQIQLQGGRTRIGALDDNDIVIPSKQVSRYHAELRIRGGRVHLWDLQARNLTYVNGKSVKNCELSPGDLITIGDAELRYDR